jgi:hypothetical protein
MAPAKPILLRGGQACYTKLSLLSREFPELSQDNSRDAKHRLGYRSPVKFRGKHGPFQRVPATATGRT